MNHCVGGLKSWVGPADTKLKGPACLVRGFTDITVTIGLRLIYASLKVGAKQSVCGVKIPVRGLPQALVSLMPFQTPLLKSPELKCSHQNGT